MRQQLHVRRGFALNYFRVAKVQKKFFHCLLMFIEIFLPTQRDAVSSKKTRLEHFPQRSRPRSLYANKELIVNAL